MAAAVIRPTLARVTALYTTTLVGTTHSVPKTLNKGKVGLYLEGKLGIPTSSACLDCSDGEVKAVPLKRLRNGKLVPKETMAVTMMKPEDLLSQAFADTRLAKKTTAMVILPYLREGDDVTFYAPVTFGASHPAYGYLAVDYEVVRSYYATKGEVTGRVGSWIQSRTKGAGKGAPKTRAWYFRASFLKELLAPVLA